MARLCWAAGVQVGGRLHAAAYANSYSTKDTLNAACIARRARTAKADPPKLLPTRSHNYRSIVALKELLKLQNVNTRSF